MSRVKQGEGTALPWYPRGLLSFSGEAADTREVPAGWWCGGVDRSASQVSPSPLVGLAAGVAALRAQSLAPPQGLEMMPTAADASPA